MEERWDSHESGINRDGKLIEMGRDERWDSHQLNIKDGCPVVGGETGKK
jgi:hypothetical protein